MWGGADYERLAQRLAPVHDDLVARLAPAPGERWLDVGTGTGEVALRAARAGAEVTGVDISEELLELARGKHGASAVRWELRDAQSLGIESAAFDVVVSCFAAIFAPDPWATAGELARACRPGGRVGLTCWRPKEGPHALFERYSPSDSVGGPDQWGEEANVERLLGDAFELEFDEAVWHFVAESPEAAWELMAEGAPPMKALISLLDPDSLAEFRASMLDFWAGFQRDGRVDEPRRYLIVTGRRR
jgi:SAM-dependent methyltransferase